MAFSPPAASRGRAARSGMSLPRKKCPPAWSTTARVGHHFGSGFGNWDGAFPPQCLGACWHGQVKRWALKARHALVCCPACPACLLPPRFALFLTIYWGVLPLMQPQGTYCSITRLVPALLAVKGLPRWRWGQNADKKP